MFMPICTYHKKLINYTYIIIHTQQILSPLTCCGKVYISTLKFVAMQLLACGYVEDAIQLLSCNGLVSESCSQAFLHLDDIYAIYMLRMSSQAPRPSLVNA